jgi:hypothetical protein
MEVLMTEWFYNIRTGEVEEGWLSLASDLDGPFATREEAARAPAIIAERSRKWAEDDARNDRR